MNYFYCHCITSVKRQEITVWKFANFSPYDFVQKFRQMNFLTKELFKRGASEAAEGCLASVGAKLVKTAKEIPFHIHLRENKLGRRIWAFFCPFSYAKQKH